jgi:hypothetical protein
MATAGRAIGSEREGHSYPGSEAPTIAAALAHRLGRNQGDEVIATIEESRAVARRY